MRNPVIGFSLSLVSGFKAALAVYAGAVLFTGCAKTAQPPSTWADKVAVSSFDTGYGENNSEIAVSIPGRDILVVSCSQKKSLVFVDISNPENPVRAGDDLDVSSLGEPTCAAVSPDGKMLAVCIKKGNDRLGRLAVYDIPEKGLPNKARQIVETGFGPDNLEFSPDGSIIVVANEAEPGGVVNQAGSVSIFAVKGGAISALKLISLGPEAHPGFAGLKPENIEPECVAISPDNAFAAVTCQENNVVALIDLKQLKVADVCKMGVAEHPAYLPGEGDELKIVESFKGRREPDGISVSADGSFYVTANEGDTNAMLGVMSGSRDVALWHKDGGLLGDTGSQIEEMAFEQNLLSVKRAAKHGVEPEMPVCFVWDGIQYVAVSLERAASLAVINLSEPARPKVEALLATGKRPEGVLWIADRKLLITANEGDGTVTLLQLPNSPKP